MLFIRRSLNSGSAENFFDSLQQLQGGLENLKYKVDAVPARSWRRSSRGKPTV